MSKKTLLNESQIRSFMKLAKLEPLTPGFVEGLTESTDDLEEGRGMRMRAEDELDEMRGDKDEMDEVRADAAGGPIFRVADFHRGSAVVAPRSHGHGRAGSYRHCGWLHRQHGRHVTRDRRRVFRLGHDVRRLPVAGPVSGVAGAPGIAQWRGNAGASVARDLRAPGRVRRYRRAHPGGATENR